MPIDLHTEILIRFICLIAVTATVAWGVMAYPLRIAPKACSYFSIANLLVLFGVYLTSLRTNEISYLSWFIADLCMLSGFILLRRGTQRLFRLASSLKSDVSLLTVTALLMLTTPPSAESSTTLGILFSLMASATFLLLAKDNFVALRTSANKYVAIVLLSPIAILGITFLFRAVALLMIPSIGTHLATIQTPEAIPMLWFFLIITLFINVIMMGNALTRLVQKIRLQADKDYLTGLWNRRSVHQQLTQLHHFWLREGKEFSLILFDLDFFKQINDSYGHQAGDKVLVNTASTLSKVLRTTDIFSRFGGEEFLVVLPVTDTKSAVIIAEKLRETLQASTLTWQGETIDVSASFGIATIRHEDNLEALLSRADNAMYQAKQTGRNNIRTSSA